MNLLLNLLSFFFSHIIGIIVVGAIVRMGMPHFDGRKVVGTSSETFQPLFGLFWLVQVF